VHFIFQPAEEGRGGADAMIKDGLFEEFPCDVIFGMHNSPGVPIGKFEIRPGAMMAGGAFFDIRVIGRGTHGARPESGVDPVLAASHITAALQSIVARSVRPQDTVVVSVTQIHAGDAYNVIPERAHLAGTVRCFSNRAMGLVEERMRQIAEGVAAGFGATAELDFRVLFPPLVNHADETKFICDTAAELVGEDNINRQAGLIMASEDFSQMLEKVPGAFIRIGNGDGEGSCVVHNPGYDFNDAAIPYGAALFVRLVEKRLARLSG
jgi:amidohydrolase